jgi:hypothetical protein
VSRATGVQRGQVAGQEFTEGDVGAGFAAFADLASILHGFL